VELRASNGGRGRRRRRSLAGWRTRLSERSEGRDRQRRTRDIRLRRRGRRSRRRDGRRDSWRGGGDRLGSARRRRSGGAINGPVGRDRQLGRGGGGRRGRGRSDRGGAQRGDAALERRRRWRRGRIRRRRLGLGGRGRGRRRGHSFHMRRMRGVRCWGETGGLGRGLRRGLAFAAQIAAHALGDGLVHRAGVGLLLGKPDGGEGVEDDARFDLELPREVVDADVCHAQLPNFVLRPLLPPMLLLPLQRFLRRRLRPGLGRFRLTGGVEPSGFAFGVGFLGGGRIGRRLQAVPRRKLGLIGQRGIEHAPLLLGLEFLTGAIQFAIHSGGEFGLCGAGLRAGLTLVDRLREGTEEFIHGDKNLFDRLGADAGNLLELLRGAAAQLFDAGDAGPSEGSDDALAQADEGSQRGLDRLPLAHQRRHLLFDLAPLLLFALDINLPAEQLGGEADVLPLLADGEGE